MAQGSAVVERVRRILRGEELPPADAADVESAVSSLKGENQFELACRLLALLRSKGAAHPAASAASPAKVSSLSAGAGPGAAAPKPAMETWLLQQHALCTCLDNRKPLIGRLRKALRLVEEALDLKTCSDQETLGVAGSIHKRLWEATAEKVHLEAALGLYRRGYESGGVADGGYTGINAAMLCDALAAAEGAHSGGTGLTSPREVRELADSIRKELVEKLSPRTEKARLAPGPIDWWLLVTAGEAHFGLGRYDEAAALFKAASGLAGVAPWQKESTARQLVRLWRLRSEGRDSVKAFRDSGAQAALDALLPGQAEGVASTLAGRVGLGLSGGGYRAALFHLGVLAKLAECDLLRQVEVISCVSGGSILGAMYYLELKNLLERKKDDEIGAADYVELVEHLVTSFEEGTRFNVRMNAFAELGADVRMGLDPDYSRTERGAELFDRELFSRVREGVRREAGRAGPLTMDELRIAPAGEPASFRRRFDNWRRRAKVPKLILNATALNSGHNWQFSPTTMGEPPAVHDEIDCNYMLCRMRYEEAPGGYKHFPLRRAVSASACVPALFEPVVLKGLYEGKTLRLVDGGVHDNQGVFGLQEQECTVMLISDASGQTQSIDDPPGGILLPLLRASDVMQARIRVDVVSSLKVQLEAKLLQGLVFLHLKKDVEEPPVSWIGCPDPPRPLADGAADPLTTYGVPKDVQKRLAGIRTDLDSFAEVESYGLMASGYRMADAEPALRDYVRKVKQLDDLAAVRRPWKFLAIEDAWQLTNERRGELLRFYEVGADLLFKAWQLHPTLLRVRKFAVAAGIVLALCLFFAIDQVELQTRGLLGRGIFTAGFLVLGVAGWWKWRPTQTLRVFAGALWVALVAHLHVRYFDPMYLELGRIARFVSVRPAAAPARPAGQ